jgi:Flp pilus assembly protein TadB
MGERERAIGGFEACCTLLVVWAIVAALGFSLNPGGVCGVAACYVARWWQARRRQDTARIARTDEGET